MRVALLPSAYAPAIGGVEETTRRLARRLAADGDEVQVWTIRHPPALPPDEEVDGVRVRRFVLPLPAADPRRLTVLPAAAGRAFAALARAAAEFRPDLLHVHCFSANGVYATALAARRRLPLVVTLHGETVADDSDIYGRSLALRAGLRLGLRRADAVTAPSRFVLDDAGRFGLPPGAGTVVPNGVEVAGDARPEALEVPYERFVLGLGRLVPNKGFDLLLEAFAKLAPARPDVGLVMAGDGPARAALARRADAFALGDRVLLPGWLNRRQVAWALSHADVVVLPSRVEAFGIVALEALAAGRPVVVSSRGGACDLVRHRRDGLVVDPVDTAALAAAVDRLLDDPVLAARLSAAGRRRAAEFDWAAVTERYRDVYRSVA